MLLQLRPMLSLPQTHRNHTAFSLTSFTEPHSPSAISLTEQPYPPSLPLDQLLAQSSSAFVSSSFSSPSVDVIKNLVGPLLVANGDEKEEVKAEPTVVIPQQKPNRCLTCRRRVGLTGFKCRCGMVFCGTHRYPEQHGCKFDFKSLGKEQIVKANHIVKGEKQWI